MKIEVLYPEYANLCGDMGNIRYLKLCLPEWEIIETNLNSKPRFLSEEIALVYMGTMTEKAQELIIEKLMPFKKEIKNKIAKGQLFLFTGNALEIMGDYIENEDKSKIEALKIFSFYTKRNMLNRSNTLMLGDYNNYQILGFKSHFTTIYGDNSSNYFMKTKLGYGFNKESIYEGLHINNFIGVSIIGPILILNPCFTKELLSLMKIKNNKLKYEKELFLAYEKRLNKFQNLCK